MRAQTLRQRVTYQRKVEVVDPDTGYQAYVWQDRIVDEPADYLAGPGREYLAGEALRGLVTGRFVHRWSSATNAIRIGDRALWDGRVLSVKAPPIVDPTGRREVTVMIAEDGTDGA